MPRPGYLNVKVTPSRQAWLTEMSERLGLGDSHREWLQVLDYALMYAYQRVFEEKETFKNDEA